MAFLPVLPLAGGNPSVTGSRDLRQAEWGFRRQVARQQSQAAHVRSGSKADIAAPPTNVRFTPKKRTSELNRGMSALCQKQTFRAAAKISLFDHPIRARKHRSGDCDAKSFGGLEVNDEIELGRLLDRNFGGLRTT